MARELACGSWYAGEAVFGRVAKKKTDQDDKHLATPGVESGTAPSKSNQAHHDGCCTHRHPLHQLLSLTLSVAQGSLYLPESRSQAAKG